MSIFDDIAAERKRQDELWGVQRHSMFTWLSILGEEYGEICEACNEAFFSGGSSEEFRKELVQVAAVAVAIIEHIDSNDATSLWKM